MVQRRRPKAELGAGWSGGAYLADIQTPPGHAADGGGCCNVQQDVRLRRDGEPPAARGLGRVASLTK